MLKLVANDGVDLDFMAKLRVSTHTTAISWSRDAAPTRRRSRGPIREGASACRRSSRSERVAQGARGTGRSTVDTGRGPSRGECPDVAATVDRAFRDFESGRFRE